MVLSEQDKGTCEYKNIHVIITQYHLADSISSWHLLPRISLI
uniref:Uncharacterized protein n=1 Tax=Setaria italica TaxID=4555 RepID=K3ZP63_SETIT